MELKVNDVIQEWDSFKDKSVKTFYIKKVQKNQAICDKGFRFFKPIKIDVKLPHENHLGKVNKVISDVLNSYYVLKRKEDY